MVYFSSVNQTDLELSMPAASGFHFASANASEARALMPNMGKFFGPQSFFHCTEHCITEQCCIVCSTARFALLPFLSVEGMEAEEAKRVAVPADFCSACHPGHVQS